MKKIFALTIVSLILMSLNIYAGDPLSDGKSALASGNIPAAIKAFKEAIKENKKNPEAYLMLGTAYLKTDSLDLAIAALIQARELDPKNPKIFELMGDVYNNQKILAAAIEQYKKVIELDKKNLNVYIKLAEASKKARQYNDAAEAYINVLLIDSTNVIALRELATLYLRAKQYQNALPLYRDLIKYEPDSLSHQINYVKVLNETKYYADLIPYAENILSKDPSNIEIKNILRDAYIKTGDYKKAEKFFTEVDPDTLSAEELVKRGKMFKSLEKYDEAISSFELAYKKDSTLSDIFYDLATLYNKKERYADAIVMFNKKIEADTSSNYRWACYFQAAQSYANMKNYKKAKEYILKSLEHRPEYINAWDMLAQYNGALGLTSEQSAAYRKVIELVAKADTNGNGSNKYKSSLDAAYRSEGSRLMNEKKYPEAIEYFKKALQLNPKDCNLLLAIGSLYQRNKQDDEAKKYYCKVLQLSSDPELTKSATQGLKIMGEDCK